MKLFTIKKVTQGTAMLVVLMGLFGCALSPQGIDLHVQKPYKVSAQGQQKVLSLSVFDMREDKVLGSRGGTYAESSHVSISNDIEQVMQQAFSFSLHQAGFALSDSQPNAPKLVVSIRNFEYEVAKTGVFEKTIKISIQVDAQLSDELSESTRVIESWAQWQRFNYPSDEQNEAYVLEVFNDVLKQLIEDKELNQLLQAL